MKYYATFQNIFKFSFLLENDPGRIALPQPGITKKYKVNVTSETIKEAFANDQVLEDIL